ncbi:hypothetical protein HDU84_008782 [Entophlyctis sp. JEL0112]|nr:hypothetical protein HDU84_008782 [Entophlyctis sp. JEL0112]
MKLFSSSKVLTYDWDIVTQANWNKYPNPESAHVVSVDILDRSVDPVTGVLTTERLLCVKQAAPSILRAIGLPIPELAWFREVSTLDPRSRVYTADSVNLTMRELMIVKERVVYQAIGDLKRKVEDLFDLSVADKQQQQQQQPATSSSWFSWGSSSDATKDTVAAPAAESSQVSDTASKIWRPSSPTNSISQDTSSSTNGFTEFIQTAEFHAQIGISSIRSLMEDAAATRFKANAAKGLVGLESVIRRILGEIESQKQQQPV